MNRQIRGLGIAGEQVLHAEEIPGDDWRAVDCERSAGICRYDRQMLITRIADMIGAGLIYWLDLPASTHNIDRAGNIWLDREYLAPHQYLPALIT